MNKILLLPAAALAFALAGCDIGPKSGKGFSLPEGDVARGQAAFAQLQCNACHTVTGDHGIAQPENADISVALGGQVRHIQTYGELVTSIINPSHRLAKGYSAETVMDNGESKMKNYNEVMTVQQLIDLVAFLQAQYELLPYDPTLYPTFH